MKTLYQSELTNQIYESEADLKAAEDAFKAEKEAKEKKNAQRAERAKEVEDAYKAAFEATRKADELRDKFLKDYGTFHYTYKDGENTIFDAIWNIIFR